MSLLALRASPGSATDSRTWVTDTHHVRVSLSRERTGGKIRGNSRATNVFGRNLCQSPSADNERGKAHAARWEGCPILAWFCINVCGNGPTSSLCSLSVWGLDLDVLVGVNVACRFFLDAPSLNTAAVMLQHYNYQLLVTISIWYCVLLVRFLWYKSGTEPQSLIHLTLPVILLGGHHSITKGGGGAGVFKLDKLFIYLSICRKKFIFSEEKILYSKLDPRLGLVFVWRLKRWASPGFQNLGNLMMPSETRLTITTLSFWQLFISRKFSLKIFIPPGN